MAATVLLIPVALFLFRLLAHARRRLASVGAVLVVLGVVGSAGVFALDFASIELAGAGDAEAMRVLFSDILDNPGVRLLRSLEIGLPIGLLVLAWGLWRAEAAPPSSAVAIAAGAVFSNPALPEAVGPVGGLLLLAGFAGTAALAFSDGSEATAKPL